jgi:TatD DNase family protein
MADPPLVDFHCHVDLYEDHAGIISESERFGIYTLAVTTTPKAWRRNQELASQSRFVRVALGLHPQLVAERAGELTQWRELLREARYVGEVGLDAGPRFVRSLERQKELFTAVLQDCALQGGKILTVHSVRSVKLVLDLVEAHLTARRGRLVLHWFTGTKAEARRAVDLGCYFSINAQMLLSERNREVVGALPSDRLLTETDGPFTKTAEGEPTRPRHVRATLAALADVRRTPAPALTALIASNLRSLVGDG